MRFCLLGALDRACTNVQSYNYGEAQQVLSDMVLATARVPGVMSYNDEAGRTQLEVLALLDRARACVLAKVA